MSILDKIQESVPSCVYGIDVPIDSLPRHIEQYEVILDPEYQRGHVWTRDQQQRFVGALLESNRSIPPVWLNWEEMNTRPSEVVDGKQRIKACLDWLNGEFSAICPCGIEVHYDDLCPTDRRGLLKVTMRWNWVMLSKRGVMEYYLRLNTGGSVHTPEELDRVRGLISDYKE